MLKKRKLLSELLHILFVFFHHEIPDRNTKDIFLFFRESFRSMETLDQVEKGVQRSLVIQIFLVFIIFFPGA